MALMPDRPDPGGDAAEWAALGERLAKRSPDTFSKMLGMLFELAEPADLEARKEEIKIELELDPTGSNRVFLHFIDSLYTVH